MLDSGLLLSPEAPDHKRYLLADPALYNLLRNIVDFRKTIRQNEGKSERRQIIEESEMVNTKNKTNSRIIAINEIKKKHANTGSVSIRRYPNILPHPLSRVTV